MTFDHDQAIKALMAERAPLLGYIRAIVGDPHLAEDVFQEVVLVVVRKGGAAGAEERFPAWVRTVARYEALAALRRRHAHVPFDDALLDALDAQWSACEEAEPTRPAVEALRQCLGRLSPTSRRLVTAKYERACSGDEIAAEIGRPVNSVYVALSRIHKALADCVRNRLARGAADAV
jgi:RNA polymerase sigma-70 factor (ECF subfamily)